MRNLEESTKIAKETRFATIGRAIADTAASGGDCSGMLREAMLLRQIEQNSASRQTQFAALARQIGDAMRAQQNTHNLIARLLVLRHSETSGQRADQTSPAFALGAPDASPDSPQATANATRPGRSPQSYKEP